MVTFVCPQFTCKSSKKNFPEIPEQRNKENISANHHCLLCTGNVSTSDMEIGRVNQNASISYLDSLMAHV